MIEMLGINEKLVAPLLLIAIICLVIYGSVYIIKRVVEQAVKSEFLINYGIEELPRSVKIRRTKDNQGRNYYKLRYPYWYASKKDGTADLRKSSNAIIWQQCELHVDDYLVISKRPYDMIEVVKRLRTNKVKIDFCKEEERKCAELIKKREAFNNNDDINKIISFYAEKPTDFEILCSELFRSMGYSTRVTPATNDGGYDILMDKGYERTIVECKCYATEHKIGRPSIQKLVGANSVVSADRMLFITTSDFSSSAITYANQVGVELINGYKLTTLLEEQGFLSRGKVEIKVSECQLTPADLYPYIPKDIYYNYFA